MARTGGRIGDVRTPYQSIGLWGAPPYRAIVNGLSPYTFYKNGQPMDISEDHSQADFYTDTPQQKTLLELELPHMCVADPFRVGKYLFFPLGKRVDTGGPATPDSYRLAFHVVDLKTGQAKGTTEVPLPGQTPSWPDQFFSQDGDDLGIIPWWTQVGHLMYSNWPDWVVGPLEHGGMLERLLVWREKKDDLTSQTIAIPKVAMSPTLAGYEAGKDGTVRQLWQINTGGETPRLWTPIGISKETLVANYEEWTHASVANAFGLGAYTHGFVFYESNLPNPIAASGKNPGEVGYNYGENFRHQDWPPPYPTDQFGNSFAMAVRYPPSGTYGGTAPGSGSSRYVTEGDVDEVFNWLLTYWGEAVSGQDPTTGHVLYWVNRTSSKVPSRHVRGLAKINIKSGTILSSKPGETSSATGVLLAGAFRVGWWKSPLVPPNEDPANYGACVPYELGNPDSLKSLYIPDEVPKVGDPRLIFENEWAVSLQEASDLSWPSDWLPDGPIADWQWLRSNTSLSGTYSPQFERWRLGSPFAAVPPPAHPAWSGSPRRKFYTVRMWVEGTATYPIERGKRIPADTTQGVFMRNRFALLPRPAIEWNPDW